MDPSSALSRVLALLPEIDAAIVPGATDAETDRLRKVSHILHRRMHCAYRKRGAPYPKRICPGCAGEFSPKRVAGSSPTTKCDRCREEEERQNRLRRGKR